MFIRCFLLVMIAAQVAQAQPAVGREVPASFASLVDTIKGTVVNVDVMAGRRRDDDWVRQLFGQQPRDRPRQGAGSGFIVDPKGLVLTNNHVVDGAVAIRVRLDDGRSFEAEVLGRDPLTDLALLRLRGKTEQLPVARFGNSDAVRSGDWVLAIGNPFGLSSSVSVGIISARARDINAGPYDDFLQTDAAINPGNSGGPLFNARGEVVGINTIIIGGGTGIGFAVPSNLAKALLPQLQLRGSVRRGWLGIGIQDLGANLARALAVPKDEGAVVTSVNDGSPAAKGGLREDDVIVAIDGEPVQGGGALIRKVGLRQPDTEITLTLFRGGKSREVTLALGVRPDFERIGSIEKGEAAAKEKSELGLRLEDVGPRTKDGAGRRDGAVVVEVEPGSAADLAQLEAGTVVIEVNQKPVRSTEELRRALKAAKSGSVVLLRGVGPGGQKVLRALLVP